MSINISASLIHDFLSCNRKVYYRINFPEVSVPNREMILGTIVHQAIEHHWNSPIGAADFVRSRLPPNATKDDLEFCHKCISTFFGNFSALLANNDSIEEKFRIEISDGVFIVGKVDRVSDGIVYDWKTSRNPPMSVDNDPQFILYNWAYRNLHSSNPVGVYYASLATGRLIRFNYDSVLENLLMKEVIPDMVKHIKNSNLIPTGLYKKECFRCPYKSTCLKEIKNVVDSRDTP